MAHVARKQPVWIGVGRRAGRPLWVAVAAALAIAGLLLVLLVAGGGEKTTAPDGPGAPAATLNGADGIRYDGGPDEGTRGIVPAGIAQTVSGIRYDGGPDEGTRGVVPAKSLETAPRVRYDGGPEEGTRRVGARR
jgi:hypothetical protein